MTFRDIIIKEAAKEIGAKDMKHKIINKLPEFQNKLTGPAYDNFPLEELIEWIKRM